jgi:hypothetical protein
VTRRKLVDKIDGKAGQGVKGAEYPPWAAPRAGTAAGIVVDGGIYRLAGEPPVGVSDGWGDMSWLSPPRS